MAEKYSFEWYTAKQEKESIEKWIEQNGVNKENVNEFEIHEYIGNGFREYKLFKKDHYEKIFIGSMQIRNPFYKEKSDEQSQMD